MIYVTRRAIATTILFLGILAAPAAAYAEPASIDDGSGPREVGAQIEDGSGTPGPNYSVPNPKPSRGDYASDSDYQTAVGLWSAAEAGRLANLAASK